MSNELIRIVRDAIRTIEDANGPRGGDLSRREMVALGFARAGMRALGGGNLDGAMQALSDASELCHEFSEASDAIEDYIAEGPTAIRCAPDPAWMSRAYYQALHQVYRTRR